MPAPDGTRERKPEPVAPTKLLRGFGISTAQQFAISYVHIVACMREEQRQRFTLDLLTGGISPPISIIGATAA